MFELQNMSTVETYLHFACKYHSSCRSNHGQDHDGQADKDEHSVSDSRVSKLLPLYMQGSLINLLRTSLIKELSCGPSKHLVFFDYKKMDGFKFNSGRFE